MFKIESISFINGNDFQTYKFSSHTFVYGLNTVGKTALTKAIDYVLGSSDGLTYQGLDNIEGIEAYLTNGLTNLWSKRTISGNYYYKRTLESQYSEVSSEVYKDNICLIITPTSNARFVNVYSKVFDEKPTFRSFTFLNYIEEKGLGDLSVVFTKAKELKHQIRIRNIMDFFFNYENIEQIYEKELELELAEKELSEISKDYQEFNRSLFQAKKLFRELHLTYTSDFTKDYATFLKFKNSYTRTAKSKSKDLVYLSKASFSLAEEIKLYTFMKDQSANMVNRKERISRLLSIISSIVNAHPQYTVYTQAITSIIEEIEEEKVILSLTDYTKAVKDIEQEKQKLDSQIELLRSQATELTYEVAMKKVGLLEHIFTILSREINTDRLHELEIKTAQLKKEIKSLKSAFDQSKVKKFNNRLTELYLSSGLNIKHLKEDLQDNDFSLEFDPFRLCLFATHKEQDQLTRFMPGSMTRQTHLQMLTYLCMFEYLKDNFRDFIYLPILIIDSANQPMGIEIFKEVYPTITQLADSIGVQTIFMSKDRLDNIPEDDFIDISAGLNKFHKKS